jgi:HAD superfamily hydrolase (TIGR01509 family)
VPQAVLFDLDGTLVDSERESAEALARVLGRDHGLTVTQEHRDFVVGHSWNEIYALLVDSYKGALTWSMAEIIERAGAERIQVIAEQGMTCMPGAVAAVRAIKARWPIALVTGSSRQEAHQSLQAVGLTMELDIVFAAEDYTRGKPAPDGYLAAAKRLGVDPARCVVIEDSTVGIAAAHNAGMKVIAVSAFNFLKQDQSRAHRLIATLEALTPALIEEVMAS